MANYQVQFSGRDMKDVYMTQKVDYKIISAKDFIKAKPSGEMDLYEINL
jgi:hypothetical protein